LKKEYWILAALAVVFEIVIMSFAVSADSFWSYGDYGPSTASGTISTSSTSLSSGSSQPAIYSSPISSPPITCYVGESCNFYSQPSNYNGPSPTTGGHSTEDSPTPSTSATTSGTPSPSNCGNGLKEGAEQCDAGIGNTDVPCIAPVAGSCSYCDSSCRDHTVFGPCTTPADNQACCVGAGYEWISSGESQDSSDSVVSPAKPHSQFKTATSVDAKLPADTYVCSWSYQTELSEGKIFRINQVCDGSACNSDTSTVALCDKSTDCVYKPQGSTLVKCRSDIKSVANTFFSGVIRDVSDGLWWPEVSGDVNSDGLNLVCDPGKWVYFVGVLSGTVEDAAGKPVVNAVVGLVSPSGLARLRLTDADGQYAFDAVPVGTYDVFVSSARYRAASRSGVYVHFSLNVLDVTLANFVLVEGSTRCNDDCTMAGTTICSAACEGQAACGFFDAKTMAVCNGQQAGFVKEYDVGSDVVCCDGQPYKKLNIPANFQVDAKHVARVVKAVQLPDGRLGKMVVYTFQ
jgi:hypothetical protein